MKKLLSLAFALLLVLCLCACQKTPVAESVVAEFAFPEGTSVLGVDLSGMNKEDGRNALRSVADGYSLAVSVDGVEATATAEQIGVTVSEERLDAIINALQAGAQIDTEGFIGFNEGKLRAFVNENFNKPVTEAQILFDEASGAYVLQPDVIGQRCNPNAVVSQLRESVVNLEAQSTLSGVSQILEPELKDEDADIQSALATVNAMNGVSLTYTFEADGKSSSHTIPTETIRTFISLGRDGVTPSIDYGTLEAYVAELSEKYSAGSTSGAFKTTGGGTVDLTVSYNGVYLDQEKLTEDIAQCVLAGTSGTRTAPFQAAGIRDMPYGGTYIEINLSAQHLWFYKNGECILSTNLVSGKVSASYCTPTGVFSIYGKSTNTYLEGEGYRSFVNYWMPFYGGYGLHDATWRGSFGGDIYLYNGSHGCVNLPLGSASTIYNNAPVGTKVILYGGVRSVPPQPQSLNGTTYYSVASDAGTITLDIRPRYSGPSMSYSSNNSAVATVSGGVVTIHGEGTAVITVSVPSKNGYSSATTNVTIEVHSPCDEGRHSLGSPTVTVQPTCQPGKQTVKCSKCTYSEEQAVNPVREHTFTNYSQTVAPSCKPGKETATCDECHNATHEREIPANGQHSEGSGEVTTAPGCETAGERSYKCTICGTTLRTEPIAPTDHNMAWTTVLNPTCTNPGMKQEICQNSGCSETGRTEEIPATGHNMVWQTQDATCTADGSKWQTCSNGCGTSTAPETIPSSGHSYSGGVCSKCGGADPNYVAPSDEGNGEG